MYGCAHCDRMIRTLELRTFELTLCFYRLMLYPSTWSRPSETPNQWSFPKRHPIRPPVLSKKVFQLIQHDDDVVFIQGIQ